MWWWVTKAVNFCQDRREIHRLSGPWISATDAALRSKLYAKICCLTHNISTAEVVILAGVLSQCWLSPLWIMQQWQIGLKKKPQRLMSWCLTKTQRHHCFVPHLKWQRWEEFSTQIAELTNLNKENQLDLPIVTWLPIYRSIDEYTSASHDGRIHTCACVDWR